MIYASAVFKSLNRTAVLVFDRDYSVYGPYVIDGWKGEPFDGLSSDDFLFAFCSFKLGDSTINLNEHHQKAKDHGDGPATECIGYFFNQTKVEANFDLSAIDSIIRSLNGRAIVRDFVKDNFQSTWNAAKATGQHSMNQVAKELNVTFNEFESALVG